jgi:hypothetical protein
MDYSQYGYRHFVTMFRCRVMAVTAEASFSIDAGYCLDALDRSPAGSTVMVASGPFTSLADSTITEQRGV